MRGMGNPATEPLVQKAFEGVLMGTARKASIAVFAASNVCLIDRRVAYSGSANFINVVLTLKNFGNDVQAHRPTSQRHPQDISICGCV